MTGELFPWALIACRDELEDVATSVFDLMGKTEATEDQIGKMVDQIFQVPSFSVCVCQVVWNLGKRKSSANCKFSGDGWQWWWIGERHHRHLPHANHHHHYHHRIIMIRSFKVCPRWPSRSSWPTAWPGPQFSTTRPHLGSFWLDSANLLSKWLRVTKTVAIKSIITLWHKCLGKG